MYKYRNGLLPLSFDHDFTELGSNHEYNTRHKNNFRHEMHKMKTVFTTGQKTWNKLPENVKKAINLKSFKKPISSFLKTEWFNSVLEFEIDKLVFFFHFYTFAVGWYFAFVMNELVYLF